MKQAQNKAYETPALEVYGPVSKLTRNADQANSDVPHGAASTAFPPGS